MNQPLPPEPAPVPAASSQALLAQFRPGDALFASPTGTLLGRGVAHRCRTADASPASLSRAVETLFDQARRAGRQAPVIMGVIPFEPRAPAHLFIPETLSRHAPGPDDAAPSASAPLTTAAAGMAAEPSPGHYCQAVAQALELFETTALEKVVLARSLRIETPTPVETASLMRRLCAINPRGYNFALPAPEGDAFGGDNGAEYRDAESASLVGASPELLIRREGLRVTANPLAGSTPRHPEAAEDRRRAEALARSEKDLREHALVVEAIVNALRPLCRTLDVPDGPEVIATDRLWHLSTRLEGTLAAPAMSSLAVAAALHPTPAVCGAPQKAALEAIRSLEGRPRGWFTGLVGWCDERGDGEWAIAIRCAEVAAERVRLFAGAGIVPGSSPEGELAETATKMRTLLDAMGLEYEDAPAGEPKESDRGAHVATDRRRSP